MRYPQGVPSFCSRQHPFCSHPSFFSSPKHCPHASLKARGGEVEERVGVRHAGCSGEYLCKAHRQAVTLSPIHAIFYRDRKSVLIKATAGYAPNLLHFSLPEPQCRDPLQDGIGGAGTRLPMQWNYLCFLRGCDKSS